MIEIDFLNPVKLINAKFEEIPSNKWVIIDSSNIGINFAINENGLIKVKTERVYSRSESVYTEKEFNEWRKRINEQKD